MDLIDELKKLTNLLDENGIEYALCGGLAMAVYSMPRATLDIDIMIHPSSLEKTKVAVKKIGFSVEAAPMEFSGGMIQIHRLTKIEQGTGEALSLDMLLATAYIEAAWKSRVRVEWEGGSISVVSPEGLILLKSLRGSGQDQDDIDYLRSIKDED